MARQHPVHVGYKLLLLGGLLTVIIFGGGLIYERLEPSFSYVDAVYSVVMIMTGIGTANDAKTDAGKTFNMILALVSVGILISVLGQLFRYFSSRSLRDMYDALHDRKVRVMKGHTIICGSSHTLHELLQQLEHRENLWIIVRSEYEAKKLEADGYHVHVDDFTGEVALKRAGIDTAGCVIACGESDADNAFVVLTAKHLRKDVPVIARLSRSENREKLRSAGADEIVVPAEVAAMQIREAMRALVKPEGAGGPSQT